MSARSYVSTRLVSTHDRAPPSKTARHNTVTETITARTSRYCRIPVVFRFGTYPTGMRVISFNDLISMTETSFVTALAT
jgi:hypothetical protein